MINKKSILIIFLLTSLSIRLLSQIDFTHNLYCKLVFDEIDIKNINQELINNNGIYDIFYKKDTAINCFGDLIDKFHDNRYYDPQLIIFLTKFEFDTLPNPQDSKLIDLFRINKDDIGDIIDKTFALSFDRDLLSKLTKAEPNLMNDKRFLNGNDEYWVIKKIENGDRSIFIDDCHKRYRLQFTNNQMFKQKFQNNEMNCIVMIDVNKIIAHKKMSYWGKEVFHDISINQGKWKTKNNRLYLMNENINLLEDISYEFQNNTLVLFYDENYKIELERMIFEKDKGK